MIFNRVGPDIRFGRIYWNYQARYPVLPDIQPYFIKIIRPDIRQFSALYQTLIISGRISGPTIIFNISTDGWAGWMFGHLTPTRCGTANASRIGINFFLCPIYLYNKTPFCRKQFGHYNIQLSIPTLISNIYFKFGKI